MGACPCPRCLIEKAKIRELGGVHDRNRRQTKKRLDDDKRKDDVESSRKLIYKYGKGLKSTYVENFLHPRSLVATRVSHIIR